MTAPRRQPRAPTAEELRRKAETELLDRLRAEAASPEWYPER